MTHLEITRATSLAFRAGGVDIRWYSLCIVAQFVAGWLIGRWIAGRCAFGPERRHIAPAQVDELYLLLVALGFAGARLAQAVFYDPGKFLRDPMWIFATREGGLSSHGIVLGVLAAGAIWARRTTLPYLTALDFIATSLPVSAFFIRIGNFLNGEYYGGPTDMPWGVVFQGAGPATRHPVQLYESLVEGAGGLILVAWLVRRFGYARPGLIAGGYIVFYAPVRMVCEWIKVSEKGASEYAGLSTASVLTIPLFAFGAWMLSRALRAQPKAPAA